MIKHVDLHCANLVYKIQYFWFCIVESSVRVQDFGCEGVWGVSFVSQQQHGSEVEIIVLTGEGDI